MNTTKPKSKKIADETLEVEPLIEKEAIKKAPKKPAIVKPTETEKVIEIEVSEVNTSHKKRAAINEKVIRDSFSFPEHDYLKISELKKTCLAAGIHVKKGEILRAGLYLLSKLNLVELKQAVEQVEKVKTGRPNASKI